MPLPSRLTFSEGGWCSLGKGKTEQAEHVQAPIHWRARPATARARATHSTAVEAPRAQGDGVADGARGTSSAPTSTEQRSTTGFPLGSICRTPFTTSTSRFRHSQLPCQEPPRDWHVHQFIWRRGCISQMTTACGAGSSGCWAVRRAYGSGSSSSIAAGPVPAERQVAHGQPLVGKEMPFASKVLHKTGMCAIPLSSSPHGWRHNAHSVMLMRAESPVVTRWARALRIGRMLAAQAT